MAGKFKILFVLCLVAPCLAQYEIRPKEVAVPLDASTSSVYSDASTTTAPPDASTTTAPPDASTTTVPPDASTTTAPPDASTTTVPPDASTTTAPPDASTTTVPPDASTTTAPPDASTTTVPPDASTTTAPPDASTTTVPPDASTTTAPPDASTTTVPPDASTTTAPPDASTTTAVVTSGATGGTTTEQSGGTVATTKPQPTTVNPDPCVSSPCGYGSTCEPHYDTNYVCLCLAGENYNEGTKSCEKAKVFPGELSLKSETYKEDMSDKRSKIFAQTTDRIVKEVDEGFASNKGFSGATVLELLPLSVRSTGVKATVEIIFQANATIDEKTVGDTITKATGCTNCVLKDATFQKKTLCEINACDEKTASCKATDGSFTCTCKDGYIETDFSTRVCIAACPSGQEAKDGTCTACSFGYSGFNCNESWQLVLTIVGSVLSGLLLVTLILLPVVALKSSKKSSKKSKEADIGMSQVNQPNTKAPMVTSNFSNSYRPPANGPANGFANTGMPKFPRAATNSNWESRTNLDMTPSNSRQNLIPASRTSRYDDDDDTGPYAQVRPQSNLYAQTRPQSNPYAQTRPQSNPYASSQGQSSPYFAEDVGRQY